MTTLLDAVLSLSRKLTAVRSGTADSGSTTTLVDATRFEGEDFWNKGTLINITNKEWARITDFATATGTFTFGAITAISADDKYASILPRFPLDTLIESINAVLQELIIPNEDSTSLDTVSSQTEYTLPVGITEPTIRQIWYRRNTSGDVEYDWKLLRNWSIRPADIGTQETLILESDVSAGHDLRIVYAKNHPYLDDITDEISPYVPLERWLAPAAVYALQSRMHFSGGNKFELAMINRFDRQSIMAETVHIPLPQLKGRLVAKW